MIADVSNNTNSIAGRSPALTLDLYDQALSKPQITLPNISRLTALDEAKTELARPQINFACLERPPSDHAGLTDFLPSGRDFDIRFQGCSESDGRDFELFLENSLKAYGCLPPSIVKEFYTDTVSLYHQAAALFETWDLVFASRLLSYDYSVSRGGDPRQFSRWHADTGITLNLIWTPSGNCPHATEVTHNANVRTDKLIGAWLDNNFPESIDRTEDFIIDPAGIFTLPNNHIGILMSEVESDEYSFNTGKSCIHRGIPLNPGERRIINTIMTTGVPSYLEAKTKIRQTPRGL